MNRIKRIISFCAGLAVLYGMFRVALYVWHAFLSLQKEVAVALVAATATILVSVFSVLIAKHIERRRAIEAEIRIKKIPMYVSFVEFWMKTLQNSEADALTPEEKEQKIKDFFVSFTQELMIWGSDDVVSKWSRLRRKFVRNGQTGQQATPTLFLEFEELLLAIRRDTGHQSNTMKKGELLGLFVNDIDDVVAAESHESSATHMMPTTDEKTKQLSNG